MVTFEFALDTLMKLPYEEQEDVINIVKKRRSQEWRADTAKYYIEYKKSLKNGLLKPITVKEAIIDLHNYLETDI